MSLERTVTKYRRDYFFFAIPINSFKIKSKYSGLTEFFIDLATHIKTATSFTAVEEYEKLSIISPVDFTVPSALKVHVECPPVVEGPELENPVTLLKLILDLYNSKSILRSPSTPSVDAPANKYNGLGLVALIVIPLRRMCAYISMISFLFNQNHRMFQYI